MNMLTRMEINENQNLATIREMLTRMEINENQIIDKYKQINTDRLFYTITSFVTNSHLMDNHPELLDDDYLRKYRKLMNDLNVFRITDEHKEIHMGAHGDGGYLIVDNFDKYPCKLLYSMGVGGDVSFEDDMANNGFQIFMYDHTVDAPPTDNENFHFFKKGLIGHHDDSMPDLMTLEEMLETNGHKDEENIFFKCDIEGSEIDVINKTPSKIINKFTEIVMELHFLTDYNKLDDIISALEKLNKTHKLVHVHPNNIAKMLFVGDIVIPDCVELTYVRSSDFDFDKEMKYKSGENDYPCDAALPEHFFYYNSH